MRLSNRFFASLVPACWVWACACIGVPPAQAQTPANPYNYSRTSSFTYYGAADLTKNGLLKTETIEPDNIASCVVTTHSYDAYGNKTSAATANCAGSVPARQQFTGRTSTATYDPAAMPTVVVNGTGITLPKGAFPITSANALGQTESKEYDPRFGAVTNLTGPNGLTTTWTLDGFGRTIKQTSADGTSTASYYCYVSGRADTASNTAGCPSPASNEIPLEAVSFVHSEPRNTSDVKMGPFSRVYSDRLGRTIRTVTESFDGANQTTSLAGVAIVQDVVYNVYGARYLQTQPYFLASGSSTTTGSNDVGVTRTDYDALGRPIAVYVADANGQAGAQGFGAAGSVGYGVYGPRTAAKTSYVYAGLVTTTTYDKGQQRKEEKNVEGKVVRITDANGAQLAHQYDAFGNLVATKDALQNTVTLSYDLRGRKTQLSDPDTGLWKYDYDALGQLVWQESPTQRAGAQTTTMAYDVLGRMTSRTEPEGTTTWKYDQYTTPATDGVCIAGIGKLCDVKVQRSATATDYFTRKLVYDSLGRPLNTRTSVNGGPAATVTPLPSTPGGTPVAGTTLAVGTALWTANVVNAWGKTETQSLANGVNSKAVFEAATGRPTDLSAGTGSNVGATANVFGHAYTWDSLNNLQTRIDRLSAGGGVQIQDIYQYADNLNRLTQYTVNAPQAGAGGTRAVTLQYNALGMLLYKSDVGVYSYGASGNGAVRPHALVKMTGTAVTSYTYDANGNLTAASGGKYRSITYNSFNLPDSQTGIVGAAGGSAGGTAQYTWAYDENHARMKETRTITGGTLAGARTTWNLHPDSSGGLGYEMEVNSPSPATTANPAVTSHRHYLSAGGQVIGVLVSTGSLPALTATQTAPTALGSITLVKVEYWHKDHLGSLAATTDHAGNVTARYAYDPFGKRRNLNGSYDPNGNLVIDFSPATNTGTDRGYTGHEHLDDVGIVHMNGRLFDPRLGLFMQGDPFIQNPGDLQNFNRYGYCLNNPGTCTDPSGFWGIKNLAKATGLYQLKELADWENRTVKKVWHNPVVKVVVIAVASYYTAGWASGMYSSSVAAEAGYAASAAVSAEGLTATELAAEQYFASSWAYSMTYASAQSSVVGMAIGGAAGGFTGGMLASNGRIKAGVDGAMGGAIAGGVNGYFGVSYPAQRVVVNGVASGTSAAINGGDFNKGFRQGVMVSSLMYLNTQMRSYEIDDSKGLHRDPSRPMTTEEAEVIAQSDGTGLSRGVNGDVFKLAGQRFAPDAPNGLPCSIMGCRQNGIGSFTIPIVGVTVSYAAGGFIDMVMESFAGPHDFANHHWFYNDNGSGIYRSSFAGTALELATNYSTSLIFAAPFAAAAIIEQTSLSMVLPATRKK